MSGQLHPQTVWLWVVDHVFPAEDPADASWQGSGPSL